MDVDSLILTLRSFSVRRGHVKEISLRQWYKSNFIGAETGAPCDVRGFELGKIHETHREKGIKWVFTSSNDDDYYYY